MHFFRMKGAWSEPMAVLYDRVVAGGIGRLYDSLVGFFFSELPADCRLLDLGCGSGQVAVRIARANPQAQVLGIDLAEGQIRRAQRRGEGLANLSFEMGDATSLAYPEGRFDQVLSVASIKHWPQSERGVGEMVRVCKPSGVVHVIEADAACTVEEARTFVTNWRFVLPGFRPVIRFYFRRFVARQGMDIEELRRLLSSAGLAEVHVQKAPGLPLIIGRGVKTVSG